MDSPLFLSPGIRWAHNFKNGLQIVPGSASLWEPGRARAKKLSLLDLSFEHPFRKIPEK
jgi:hypothetical protein